jgi:lysyl-tRNA synthetase class 2
MIDALAIHLDIPNKPYDIDFTRPWKRIPMMESLEKAIGEPLPKDLESEEARQVFENLCKKFKVDCKPPRSTTRLIDKLVGEFLEKDCKNPTFITEHP